MFGSIGSICRMEWDFWESVQKKGYLPANKLSQWRATQTIDYQRRWDFILESNRNIHDSGKKGHRSQTNFCSDQQTPFSIWQTDCALNWHIDYVLNLSKKRGICLRTNCLNGGLLKPKNTGAINEFHSLSSPFRQGGSVEWYAFTIHDSEREHPASN